MPESGGKKILPKNLFGREIGRNSDKQFLRESPQRHFSVLQPCYFLAIFNDAESDLDRVFTALAHFLNFKLISWAANVAQQR